MQKRIFLFIWFLCWFVFTLLFIWFGKLELKIGLWNKEINPVFFISSLLILTIVFFSQKKIYQLEKEINLDFLTHIYNRKYFERCIGKILRSAKKNKFSFSLLMLDLDFFKSVNDNYGHQIGDQVLKNVACILQEHVRSTDICGRYGGEEFTVLLPNTNLKQAVIVAQRLNREIGDYQFFGPGAIFKLTASIGIAYWSIEKPVSTELLLKEADLQLYHAKSLGKNRVCWREELEIE